MVVSRVWEEESKKLLFIGFRALVFQDKKISREMDDGDVYLAVWMYLILLDSTLKNAYSIS